MDVFFLGLLACTAAATLYEYATGLICLDGAQRRLRKALHRDRRLLRGYKRFLKSKEDVEKIAALRDCLEIAPQLASLHSTLGIYLCQVKDVEGARASLKESLRIDPEHASAEGFLAFLAFQEQDFEQCLRRGQRALELNRHLGYGAIALIAAHGHTRNHREALRIVDEWLTPGGQIRMDWWGRRRLYQKRPLREIFLSLRAFACFSTDRWRTAEQDLLRIRGEDLLPSARSLLFHYYLALPDLERARRQADAFPPGDWLGAQARGYMHYVDKDFAAAASVYSDSQPDTPEQRSQTCENVGWALLERKRLEEAGEQAQKALDCDPNRLRPHMLWAEIELERDNLGGAETHLPLYRSLESDEVIQSYLWGRLREKQGRLQEARRYYQDCLHLLEADRPYSPPVRERGDRARKRLELLSQAP